MRISNLLRHEIRYLYYYRKCNMAKNKIVFAIYRVLMLKVGRKHGIEIGTDAKIGANFKMSHPYNITISGYSKIGDSCTVCKGATIGVRNGTSEIWGAPTIGNKVFVGINASVIGKITVGDDVLIAPNSFVNRDVPSHSVVIGNPMQIHHKEHATKYYIN